MIEATPPKTQTVKKTIKKFLNSKTTGYAKEGVIMNNEKVCCKKTSKTPIAIPKTQPNIEISPPW